MVFTVKQGKRYRARIRLGIFEQMAGNGTIADKLIDAGFTDVSVQGSGRDRWAFGVWPEADSSAPLPDQIKEVVEV